MPIIDRNDPLSWPIGWSPPTVTVELTPDEAAHLFDMMAQHNNPALCRAKAELRRAMEEALPH